MSAEAIFEPWPDDAVHRALDAGRAAAVGELVGDLLGAGVLDRAALEFLRHWLAQPRFEHCSMLAGELVAGLRDRVARELAARAAPNQRVWLLAYYRGRGELIDPVPDDLSGLGDATDGAE